MKITLFDEIRLGIPFDRTGDGRYSTRGLFVTLLHRPDEPHPGIFSKPRKGRYWLHFTAKSGRQKPDRRDLFEIAVDDAHRGSERFRREGVQRFAEKLRPADLDAMASDGWMVHRINVRAVYRWARIRRSRRERLAVDELLVMMLLVNFWKHVASPRQLVSLKPDVGVHFIATRKSTEDPEDLEVRGLLYCPHGFGSYDDDGQAVLVHPPGWYWHDALWLDPDDAREIMPMEAAESVFAKLRVYLHDYPRNRPVPENLFAQLPPYWSKVLGFFASDLLRATIAGALDADERARTAA